MRLEVSSMVSRWITAALIEKIIERKEASTLSAPELREDIVEEIIDVPEEGSIETNKQPQYWFIDSKTVNWENAKEEIFSSLNWGKIQIGEPTEIEFIINDLISETSVKDTRL